MWRKTNWLVNEIEAEIKKHLHFKTKCVDGPFLCFEPNKTELTTLSRETTLVDHETTTFVNLAKDKNTFIDLIDVD